MFNTTNLTQAPCELYETLIRDSQANTAQLFANTQQIRTAFPRSFAYLNMLSSFYSTVIYPRAPRTIGRSSSVTYELQTAFRGCSNPLEGNRFMNKPFFYPIETLQMLNLDRLIGIQFVQVVGQVGYTFEQVLPTVLEEYPNMKEAYNVSLYLKITPKHRVRVYKNEHNIVVISTKPCLDASTDYLLLRRLYAAIPLMFEWTADTSITELIDIYKSLAENSNEKFWNLFNALTDKTDAVMDYKYNNIFNLFDNISTLRTLGLEQEYNNIRQSISDYENELRNKYAQLATIGGNILQIQRESTTYDKDAVKMLVDKRTVYSMDISQLTNTNNPVLKIKCHALCTNYNKEAATNYIEGRALINHTSMLRKLYKHIFIDEEIILGFNEDIHINFKTKEYTAQYGAVSRANFMQDIPNPHHYYYNCWGSYHNQIIKYISTCDLEPLFYTLKSAIGSLNFTDGVVMSRFVDLMQQIVDGYHKPKCFYWKSENFTTPHTFTETIEAYNKYYIEGE